MEYELTLEAALKEQNLWSYEPYHLLFPDYWKNANMKATLQALAGTNPGWAFFFKLSEECVSSADPREDFLASRVCNLAENLCKSRGAAEFQTFIDKLTATPDGVLDVLFELFDEKLELDESLFKDLSHGDLGAFLRSFPEFDVIGDQIDLLDRIYVVPTFEQMLKFCLDSPIHSRLYEAEVFDCDDFMRAFRGWLITEGYGNISVGNIMYDARKEDGSIVYAHAVNLIVYHVDEVLKAKIYEPQSAGKFWDVGGIRPGDALKGITHYTFRSIEI